MRLKPERPFLYWMLEWEVRPRKEIVDYGDEGNPIYSDLPIKRIGYGWPSMKRRWCTREKCRPLNKYYKTINNPVSCIGYAYDEKNRKFYNKNIIKRFPLIEYKITEKMALNMCKKLGYTWGGLYEIFNRVSCYCCPLQRMSGLRKVKQYFPNLWNNMLRWDDQIQENTKKMGNPKGGWYKGYKYLREIDSVFQKPINEGFGYLRKPYLDSH